MRRFRSWLARRFFRAAIICDPDQTCEIDVILADNDRRIMTMTRGQLTVGYWLYDDDARTIAQALTQTDEQFKESYSA